MTEGQRPRGSREPLCTAYDVALLDLDGVVYLGGTAIPDAAEALRKASAAGMRLAYVTNNAFRTPAAIAELLTSFGIPAAPQDVVTSAQAAARMLAERLPAGAPVLVVGGLGGRYHVLRRGGDAEAGQQLGDGGRGAEGVVRHVGQPHARRRGLAERLGRSGDRGAAQVDGPVQVEQRDVVGGVEGLGAAPERWWGARHRAPSCAGPA